MGNDEKKEVKDRSVSRQLLDAIEADHDEARRLRKNIRRAAKLTAKLAKLGLDENGDPLDNISLLKYPVREWKFKLPSCEDPVAVNPIVTLIGVGVLWSLVLTCIVNPNESLSTLIALHTSVSMSFSWFLQGSKAVLFFFMVYITYRYGHIHLGDKESQPEYSTLSYFGLSFTAGLGPAALFYCVQEPLLQRLGHFYAQAGYRSQDEVDMFAINITVSNWGTPCWTHYAVVAVCMSLAVHRFGLPLTYRSCFYPILGAYTWGWMGDFIDGLTIVVTVAGACTNLGLTAILIVSGLIHLGWIDEGSTQEEITSYQNMTAFMVVVVSTYSVMSGIQKGTQLVSNAAMALGGLLLISILVMDDTKFLLNVVVQEFGLYLQTGMLQLNFWTDAFGQLREGSGRAVDGKAAEQSWSSMWVIFYIAWVVTLGSGYGMFMAHISRGRKLWEVVCHSMITPILLCMVWFCIWGGIGLRQSRQGKELEVLGLKYFNNSHHFVTDGSEFCFDVPQDGVNLGSDEFVFRNYLPGVSPVCQFDSVNANMAVFEVLRSFHYPEVFGESGLGSILSILFILSVAAFNVASSDAATLVVDSLASNGRKNYHWTRRMYWAGTVAALTTALLSSGGVDALVAVQSASVALALPVAILMCYLAQSILLMCQALDLHDEVRDYQFPDQPEFDMPVYGGVFNYMEYIVSFGRVNTARIDLGMHTATNFQLERFFLGLLFPFVSMRQILNITYPQNRKTNAAIALLYGLCYVTWVVLLAGIFSYPGLYGLMLTFFFVAGGILGMVRMGFRTTFNLRSNTTADFISSLFLWPQVLGQMGWQLRDRAAVASPAKSKRKHGLSIDESTMGMTTSTL